MHKFGSCCLLLALSLAAMTGCDILTDAATRLAYDIKAGAKNLGREAGAKYSIQHTPAVADECRGPYTVQLDKVGALIVWCMDSAGSTLASGSTTYHARFIETPKTYIVDKAAGSTLVIEIERRNGMAVITNVN